MPRRPHAQGCFHGQNTCSASDVQNPLAGLYASGIEHARAPLPEQRRYMQAFISPGASDLIG
jgi:hypothetical protein